MAELPYRTSDIIEREYRPRLVATTSGGSQSEASNQTSDDESSGAASSGENEGSNAIFKSVQWSPDGTTLLTSSEDRTLRSYILPPDLLSSPSPHSLHPYSSHHSPSPVYATAFSPSFTLTSPSSALFLAAPASLPIRLLSPFTSSLVASYPLVHAPTERFLAPHSLVFSSTSHFLAGSDCQISCFDISRPSSEPVTTLRTIPSKRGRGGVGMKGIVSAMSLSVDGILAAGTFTRWIGLYAGGGVGDTVGVFPLVFSDASLPPKPSADASYAGDGVTSLAWSSCGRYLLIAERGADGMSVWDIRKTGRRLAWLAGRKAQTMQRLGVDVAAAGAASNAIASAEDDGLMALAEHEEPNTAPLAAREDLPAADGLTSGDIVYAGGTDGRVRAWDGLGQRAGNVLPQRSFAAHREAASGVGVHPWGGVLASCSGARWFEREEEEDGEGKGRAGKKEEGEGKGRAGEGDSEEEGKQGRRGRREVERSLRIWSL